MSPGKKGGGIIFPPREKTRIPSAMRLEKRKERGRLVVASPGTVGGKNRRDKAETLIMRQGMGAPNPPSGRSSRGEKKKSADAFLSGSRIGGEVNSQL